MSTLSSSTTHAAPRLNDPQASPAAWAAMMALQQAVNRNGLDATLLGLVKLRASQINRCAFCIDLHVREATARGDSPERLHLLEAWEEVAHFTAPSEHARQVVQRFLHATASGEVKDLVALLTDDATLYTDGGGMVASAGRPIRSADHVARFFVGVRRRVRSGTEFRPSLINGQPGALVFVGGRLDRAVSCDVIKGRIGAIYVVRNPEKLRHLAADAGLARQARGTRRSAA